MGTSCVPAVCVVREFVQTACSAGVLMKISVFGLKSEIFTCTARVSGCCSLSRAEGVEWCAGCMGACCVKGRLCGATAVRELLELKVPGELQGTGIYARHHCNF